MSYASRGTVLGLAMADGDLCIKGVNTNQPAVYSLEKLESEAKIITAVIRIETICS